MKTAILYSGGKDSTYAIEYAKEQGYDIEYLLSVKPEDKESYLFHYATVEATKELSRILGIPHIYTNCAVNGPEKEAEIVKKIVAENPVDLLLLGGIGLQETQIRAIRESLKPLNIEVRASHEGKDHGELMQEMIGKGYEIIITQVAAKGALPWLGKTLTLENFLELKRDAENHGFHFGFEGGHLDTLCIDGPIFRQKLEIKDFKKVVENEFCGHIEIIDAKPVEKAIAPESI